LKNTIAVACKVLERPAVGRDQLPECLVVRAQHFEQLLRRSGLGERREAAEVTEEAGDIGPVAGEQLLTLLRRDELRDLRRDEARQLRPLALDGVDQPCVGNRDRRLVGEGPHQLDLVIREQPRIVAADRDRPDQLVIQSNRNPEQRTIATMRWAPYE